jgi:hypothetical protein
MSRSPRCQGPFCSHIFLSRLTVFASVLTSAVLVDNSRSDPNRANIRLICASPSLRKIRLGLSTSELVLSLSAPNTLLVVVIVGTMLNLLVRSASPHLLKHEGLAVTRFFINFVAIFFFRPVVSAARSCCRARICSPDSLLAPLSVV